MASRGNERRSSADSLTRDLDDMLPSSRSKPLFYSTAFIYGSHTEILIIPYVTVIYHLPVYPVVLQNPSRASRENWKSEKRKEKP